MYNLKEIIEQIRDTGYPYFRLRGRHSTYVNERINIAENVSKSGKEPSVDDVVAKVKSNVDRIAKGSPQFVFELELLKSPTSNQGGKLGWYEFMKDTSTEEKKETTVPEPPKGLGGLGLGQVQEQMQAINAMNLAMMEPQQKLAAERTALEIDKVNLARDKEIFKKEVAAKEEELKKKEEEYNSQVKRTQKGVEKAFFNIADKYLLNDDAQGLAGANSEVEDTEELDEYQELIDLMAVKVNDSYVAGEIDGEDVKKIVGSVKGLLNKIIKDKGNNDE